MKFIKKCPCCKSSAEGEIIKEEQDAPYIVCPWCGAEINVNEEGNQL